jgi:hypothetical protein
MEEQASETNQHFSQLDDDIISLVLEYLMPQSYKALQSSEYADFFRNIAYVDKRVHGLINDPFRLWKPQLRSIINALGFEELEEKIYLKGFEKTPKQLAFDIILRYQVITKRISADYDGPPIDQSLSTPNPILSHLNYLLNLELPPQRDAKCHIATLESFKLNIQQLNDTLPPIFLALMQLSFVLTNVQLDDNLKNVYENFKMELLNKIKIKFPETTVGDNFLEQLALSFLVHWSKAKKMLTLDPKYFEHEDYQKPEMCLLLAQFVLGEEVDNKIDYLKNPYNLTPRDILRLFKSKLWGEFLTAFNQLKKLFPKIPIGNYVAEGVQKNHPISSEKIEIMSNCLQLINRGFTHEQFIKWFLHLVHYKWHILAHANYTKWEEDDLKSFINPKSQGKLDAKFLKTLSPAFLYSFLGEYKGNYGTLLDWLQLLCTETYQQCISNLENMKLTIEEYNAIREIMPSVIEIVEKMPKPLTQQEGKAYLLDQIHPKKQAWIFMAPSETQSKKRAWRVLAPSETQSSSKLFKFFDPNNNNHSNTNEIYQLTKRAEKEKDAGNIRQERLYLELVQKELNNYLNNSSWQTNVESPFINKS